MASGPGHLFEKTGGWFLLAMHYSNVYLFSLLKNYR
jgi:hypothetical protein